MTLKLLHRLPPPTFPGGCSTENQFPTKRRETRGWNKTFCELRDLRNIKVNEINGLL